ncbi:MAG: cytidine deaminase [Natronomonas sp.]
MTDHDDRIDRTLLDRAKAATESSYAPYSAYRVGAALLCADGAVFTGCNVENANYSNSIHAEELALGKAIEAGHRSFEALAVVSDEDDGVTPCGMCRQSLSEFCEPTLRVVCESAGTIERYTLGELLPAAFGEAHLR